MKKLVPIIAFFPILWAVLISPSEAQARTIITDWYIKDYKTQIVVNKDSSVTITEDITADCGDLPNKHGIYRVLPTEITTAKSTIKTPVKLLSITDAAGDKLRYSQSESIMDGTVTWKIGDPGKNVTGVNFYRIKYNVKNVVHTDTSPDFDELYINLNGNFWELEIDNFTADIIFPSGISKDNTKVSYYAGYLGSKDTSLADYRWTTDNTMEFNATRMMAPKEGITVSATFPKKIISPYKASLMDYWNEQFVWFLFPIGVLAICYILWRKYGDDPSWNKTVIAEYDVPMGLDPMSAGMLETNGILKNEFITATIVRMAVIGLITIKEAKTKGIIFESDDHEIVKTGKELDGHLSSAERMIYLKLFEKGDSVRLSELKTKNKFYTIIKDIRKDVLDKLNSDGLIDKRGVLFKSVFIVLAVVALGAGIASSDSGFVLPASGITTAIILFAFAIIMPKRTLKGTEANWKLKGFRLYMDTAEKYRAQFNEKENIFEKLLPYAIVFGMTKEWIRKMKDIYGEEYYASYHPAWYAGSMNGSFNMDSLTSSISSLSASIASNVSSPSGSGGAGGAGGGGGGGGGGGW